MSFSNFLNNKVFSKVESIAAKASGALSSIDGAITTVDSLISNLFGKVLSGENAITDANFTYEEQGIVKKDQTIASTIVDPLKVPITSNTNSPTFAEAASSPAVTKIADTQPNDIHVEPVGNEPPLAFRGQYPYVHTQKSESGHIREIDDTPGQERLFEYHRSGTYQEINADGRRVVKVVNDNHLVVVGNDETYIEGSGRLYVKGNITITCLNDAYIDVAGRLEVTSSEDFRLKAKSIYLESTGGNIEMYSAKALNTRSAANTSIYAEKNTNVLAKGSMSVKSSENIAIEAANSASIKTKSEISMDSDAVLTNMGTSLDTADDKTVAVARKTGLKDGLTREDVAVPDVIDTILQGSDDDETGEAAAQAIAEAISSGRITQEEADAFKNTTYTADATDTTTAKKVTPVATTANEIRSMPETAISDELKLSNNFRLADLTVLAKVFPYKIRAQTSAGKARTKADIAANLQLLAVNVLEPIRKKYPNMQINNGFRHTKTSQDGKQGNLPGNDSQHCRGQAADVTYGNMSRDPETMFQIAQWIKANVAFDQLVLEYGKNQIWTHVSFNGENNSQRGQVLTCKNAPTGPYEPGLIKLNWKPH